MRNLFLPPPLLVIMSALIFWGFQDQNWLVLNEDALTSVSAAPEIAHEQGTEIVQIVAADIIATVDPNIVRATLFLSERRPWPKPVVEPIEPEVAVQESVVEEIVAPPAPDFVYIGMIGGDDVNRALIQNSGGNSERWIAVGEVVGGWTVVEIRADGIRMIAQGEEILVKLNR